MEISIHVPAWGTTETDIIWKIWYSNFNPRSRVGNDVSKTDFEKFYSISIHVPAWGTTGRDVFAVADDILFQSTFPRGERH